MSVVYDVYTIVTDFIRTSVAADVQNSIAVALTLQLLTVYTQMSPDTEIPFMKSTINVVLEEMTGMRDCPGPWRSWPVGSFVC